MKIGFFLYLFFNLATAYGNNPTFYRAASGTVSVPTVFNINLDQGCFTITHTTSPDVFIPVKTDAEWSAFKAHLPAGITIAACAASSCTAQIINGCALGGAANGTSSSGSCQIAGDCSYSCNGSAWQLVSNNCGPCSAANDSMNCCTPGLPCTSSSPAVDSCGCISGDDLSWGCTAGKTHMIDHHTQNCM